MGTTLLAPQKKSYPVGWPPIQIMVADALRRHGFNTVARRISDSFMRLMLKKYEHTGKLWEKYNVVSGNLVIPRERADSKPFHGWTSAAMVVLGRLLFGHDI